MHTTQLRRHSFSYLAFLVMVALPFGRAHAQSPYLKVGEAKVKKSVISLTLPGAEVAQAAQAKLIAKTIQDDLEFVDFFSLVPATAFPQTKISAEAEVKYADWLKTGTDFLTFGQFKSEGDRAIFEFHMVNVGGNKEVFGKRYTVDSSELKILAHTVANDIVFNITGKRGIFLTKIVFQCDKTGKKELYTSNYDGSDPKQITRLRSIANAPAWSPDGTKIAFSVYNRHSDNVKNIDLYELNFKTGTLKALSNRKGINSGAAYSPTGNTLAYTMSYTGNAAIHILNLETHDSTQLTRSLGFDVDPAFSPDGNQLAFVSSRPGKPMLYIMNVKDPASVKRLTYAGIYNATPNFSPDGKKIVFAGWLDKRFDLFTITPDGGKIDRLTKDEGGNEDPFFSPDGNFIVFTSDRSKGKNIYLSNSDGGNVKRLTFGLGNCVAPKWSPFL